MGRTRWPSNLGGQRPATLSTPSCLIPVLSAQSLKARLAPGPPAPDVIFCTPACPESQGVCRWLGRSRGIVTRQGPRTVLPQGSRAVPTRLAKLWPENSGSPRSPSMRCSSVAPPRKNPRPPNQAVSSPTQAQIPRQGPAGDTSGPREGGHFLWCTRKPHGAQARHGPSTVQEVSRAGRLWRGLDSGVQVAEAQTLTHLNGRANGEEPAGHSLALGTPDLEKPFALFVAKGQGVARG